VTSTVKIQFQLEPDEDGYPPIGIELLNASPVADGLFRLKNAPFFVSEVSYGDVVRAIPSGVDRQYCFSSLVSESGFTSISIILLDAAMDNFLMDLFRGHRCVVEYGEFGKLRMLAVAIPSIEDYSKLRPQLVALEAQGQLSFAELAIADI
jgi:hypothetical protein